MDIQSIKDKMVKKKARIEQLTKEIKALENKLVQLENEHIVKLVRQESITFSELDEFLKSYRKGRLKHHERDTQIKGGQSSDNQSGSTYSRHSIGYDTPDKNQSDL